MDRKFRAWAVNEKRWIDEDELYLLLPFFCGYEIMQDYPHAYVLMEETCDPGDDGIEKVLEIKWCQFTGLKDKNGKEIYEGDVLHQDCYSDWVVEWEGSGFKVYNFCNPGVYFPLVLSDREIIGNIYENPELLVEKEDI